MYHCKFIIIFASFLFASLRISAQEENFRFTANLYGGIYADGEPSWIVEPSIAWHFHKYIGVAFGVELTSQYGQSSHLANINGYEACLTDSEKNIAWIAFKPSVIFKTPNILRNDNDISLWFQAEPGLNLACPFRNSLTYDLYSIKGNVGAYIDSYTFRNKGLEWFYWNVRVSVNMAFYRFVFGAGYGISNFDYYSCRRNVTLYDGTKFHTPKKTMAQSVFLSIGYKF